MRILLLLAALSLLPATALANDPALSADHAWFRYLLPQIPAAGYLSLHNAGDAPMVLVGAKSPSCGAAMLHKSENKSGMDMMVAVKSVTVPAHGSFAFSPGAYHIMCTNLTMRAGDTVPVTLLFENAPALIVDFKVYGADGPPDAK